MLRISGLRDSRLRTLRIAAKEAAVLARVTYVPREDKQSLVLERLGSTMLARIIEKTSCLQN